MSSEEITKDTKVGDVLAEHPDSFDVFMKHGCPDMRRGVFSMTAKVMPLKWAAFFHRVPLEVLLSDLRLVAERSPRGDSGQVRG
jgi:hypothetical protein